MASPARRRPETIVNACLSNHLEDVARRVTRQERNDITRASFPDMGINLEGEEAVDVGDVTPISGAGIPNSNVLAQAHMARKEEIRTFATLSKARSKAMGKM